ncbi:MAG TPA: glycoside hydrolase family 15 protein [Solirubrobacteraceae bacterium]|nr:glycoside hydrolase family 15 protein [Solirubrobacteraceae bacterium]
MTAGPRSAQPHVLRDYALIADGRRGALVGPHGDVAWMCAPSWADEAAFASLLGGVGAFSVTPRGRYVWGGRYEPGSLIWRSRWVTETGILESRDALAFPGDPQRAVLLRRIVAVRGPASVEVVCAPASDYGRAAARGVRLDEEIWRGRIGEARFALSGVPSANAEGAHGLSVTLELAPGESRDLVLSVGADGPLPPADVAWRETETAWREQAPPPTVGLAARDAGQARAVLRGLTTPGGGMVAAATMSLPERAEAGRSYDYRYAWVRDQAMAGQAAARAEADDLLDDATAFLRARLLDDGPGLRPAYTVDGGPLPAESTLGLPGYPGGADVSGNHAGDQFQLDAFGESLLCLAAADERDRLDADGWRAVEIAADAIAARRGEPDAGIWELENRHWTHSRLICVAGLQRIAARPTAGRRAAGWLALADELLANAADAVAPDGHWRRATDDDRVDGALLFAGIRGATRPDDPRALATHRAVEDSLSEDFFCWRYRPDARPLGEAEGAFLLCGFAVALSLHTQGRHTEAAHWFERNRSACATSGLLSEEYDVAQRQLRGNLPQAFVHALLLECAAALRPPDRESTREDAP